MNSTEIEVKQMQIQLTNMKPELEKATIATASVINQIQIDTVSVVYSEKYINIFNYNLL